MVKLIVCFTFITCFYNWSCRNVEKQNRSVSIFKMEMHLSAYGVESDNFPTIDAYIDFVHDSSNCTKWFYNPAYKPVTYSLSNNEIRRVLALVQNSDLAKLQKEYRVGKTDEPTSTITIYTEQKKFVIKDYGLEGEHPLQELYKLVYKLY